MTYSIITNEQQNRIVDILRSYGAVVGYLFGSYARGRAGYLSDIDIGVIFPKNMALENQSEQVENIRNDLEKIFGRDKVDVTNVPKLHNPLLRYIITLGEGKVLFADDVLVKNRIADIARREFEDTHYLRSIQYQALKSLF